MPLDNKKIAREMTRIALFVFLAKLIAAAKEIAIAGRYGISETVDAYLFVFNLMQWPVAVWFSVLSVVLLPLAPRIQRSGLGNLSRFRAELSGLTLLMSSVLFFAAWFGFPLLLNADWLGMANQTRHDALAIARWLAWLAPLGLTISLFSAWAMSAGRHSNSFLEGMPALGILIMVLLTPGGIEPLIWGTLAGTAFQLFALVASRIRSHDLEAPRFSLGSNWWGPFRSGFGIMLVGQLVLTFTDVIDQLFAATLGTGAISTLGYSNRILVVILGLGATAIFRAALPAFSATIDTKQSDIHSSTLRWVWGLFFGGVLVLAVGWTMSPWVVGLLYEHGAFTSEDTLAVSNILRIGLTQVPFYFGAHVLLASFASRGMHRRIAAIYGVNFIVKVVAILFLLPVYGLVGLVASSTIMYMMRFFLFLLIMRR